VKGLLLKDLYVLMRQMKIFLVMIVIFALVPGGSMTVFAVVYAGMMPYTALAYDERCKWDVLAGMMPYTKRQIVLSKYVLGYLFVLGTAVFSLLAHITSSAYVKSPEAQQRRGFSAGSFQDLTRVARLDEAMWTELFLDNADYLTEEVDILVKNLTAYLEALKARDADTLCALLREGREKKAAAGGN